MWWLVFGNQLLLIVHLSIEYHLYCIYKSPDLSSCTCSFSFILVAAMVTLRVMGESVPYSKLIEGVLTVALIGYFFLLLTKWQENVQAGNAN